MRGELDFAEALRSRVALLKGLEDEVIDLCRSERVQIMPGAKALVQTMAARGAKTVLVSGGFTRFAEPVGKEIGFERVVANVLDVDAARLTGRSDEHTSELQSLMRISYAVLCLKKKKHN